MINFKNKIPAKLRYSTLFYPKAFLKVTFEKNLNMRFHTHFTMEFLYIVSGSVQLIFDDNRSIELNPKQFVIIKPNKTHRLEILTDSCDVLVLELINEAETIDLSKFIADFSEFSEFQPIKSVFSSQDDTIVFRDTSNIHQIMSQILELLKAHEDGILNELFEIEYEVMIKQLFIAICRCRMSFIEISQNHYVNKAMSLIREKFAEDLDVVKISEFLDITPSYLQKLFKSASGLTVMKVISMHRLKQAEYLILHSDMPLSTIAVKSGLKTQNNLYRLFAAEYGCSPSLYRQQNKKQSYSYY